jgi:TolA-binding protein
MKRCAPRISAGIALLLLLSLVSPAAAIEEADRLWLVGERAFADGLYAASRRSLERFVTQYPKDARLPEAVLLLGKARLQTGDLEPALEAFKRAETLTPAPGRPQEARFWEAETLFRLKRFADARPAYDDVLRGDAAGPLAADALYGRSWSDLELKHPDAAVAGFRELLAAFPDHALAPSATLQAARALADLKKTSEAVTLLTDFKKKFPNSPLVADALFWSGYLKSTGSSDPRSGVADLRAFLSAYPNHAQAPTARKAIDQADTQLTRRTALDQANAAFKQKNWKAAVTHATVATKSDEDAVRSEAWLLVGESELKQKRFAAAAKAFEAVGAVSEVEGSVKFRALAGLGLAREEQQDWKGALTAYEAVANRSPDSTLRDWARERVTAVKARVAKPAAPVQKPPTNGSTKKDSKS